jgi:fructose-1-phosphate kinase PfkB-like protein
LRIVDLNSAAQAARQLHELGASIAAITLGDEGAVLSAGRTVWHAAPPRFDRGSAVGAGDAFLAALLEELEVESPMDSALRRAVAAGAAVLQSTGSELLTQVAVQQIYESIEARPLG